MKNILVTGATSLIGVHIIDEYIKNNCQVIAVIRPNSKNISRLPLSNLLTIVEIEMEKIENIINIIQSKKVDIFYHLAWEGTRVPYRDDAVLQSKNYQYTINTMKVAKRLGCKIFIGAGSQAEYGKCIGRVDERYPTKPSTEYGKAKLMAYETLRTMAKQSNIKFIWTRIFSVYGIYDYKNTLVMTALEKMKRNESIQLTQCTQNWDFIYAEDVARAMYLLANTSCMDGVYNIASGYIRQLKDFILDMKEICNSTSELQFGALPYGSEGIISFEPIVDKLKKNLQWSCKVEFNDGIKKVLKFID